MEEESYHTAVMVREVVSHLNPERGGLYFDGTVGAGGHTAAILEAGETARVIGVDQDEEALAVAGRRLERFGKRVELVRANFADAMEMVSEPLAGVLLDLGISSRQIDAAERGFSFRPGTPLDMRMAGSVSVETLTAADLLHGQTEAELAQLFWKYADEPRSRRLAAAIVERRATRPFRTSDDLLEVMESVLGRRMDVQDRARIFQALRIAVNDEMGVLERVLPAAREKLDAGGVFVVLSYHSLEDRRVKDAFREWSRSCVCPPELPECRCRGRALGKTLTRKPQYPSPEEVAVNPRARSAKLRAWRKAA